MAVETDVLEKIKRCSSTVLNLSHSGLKVVPVELSEAQTLKVLLLNDNNMIMPPTEVAHLKNLEILSLENNDLTLLPDKMTTSLQCITFLNLSHNKLCCLPTTFACLTSLKSLWLSHTQLGSFPREVCHLHRLEMLSLDGNGIDSVVEDAGSLVNLKWLSLAKNTLTKLGPCFLRLEQLKVLNLEGNLIDDFPSLLLSTRIANINLRRNRIAYVTQCVADGLVASSTLSKLDLRDNRLDLRCNPKAPWMDLDFVFVRDG